MDLTTLRSRCLTHLGLSDAAELDGGVNRLDEALNRWWRYELPNKVLGIATHGSVVLNLSPSVKTVNLKTNSQTADALRSLTGPIYIGDKQIIMYSEPDEYYRHVVSRTSTVEGQPRNILRTGMTIRMDPTPEVAMSMEIFGHLYNSVLTDTGIASQQEARAVYLGGALDLAVENDLAEDAQKLTAMSGDQIDSLSMRYSLFALSSPSFSSAEVRDL